MAEVTVKQSVKKESLAPFVVNLENDETGEKITHRYTVKRLGNKDSMQASLLLGELARDELRKEIVGSQTLAKVIAGTTPVHEKDEAGKVTKQTPEILDLFDSLDDDGFDAVVTGLLDAARSTSIGS